MKKNRFAEKLFNLFRHNGRIDLIVVALFAIINIIVIVNAVLHYPKIGYDVVPNLNYIQVLSHRLPESKDTTEFFSPPLPFVLPAGFDLICEQFNVSTQQAYNGINISQVCRLYDGKFAQGVNVLLSIGTILLLLLISDQIKPGNRFFKIAVLVMLANLTVYYKTFSQVRGEPYVVFFITFSIFLIHEVFRSPSFNYKLAIATGISLGCLVLSRQWGFFIFPAIILTVVWVFIQDVSKGWLLIRQFALVAIFSVLVGGWFYIHLYQQYGTFSAFNITKQIPPTPEQTYNFFRQTHLGDLSLFQQPVRPVFHNLYFPILYSDTWGDYWGFFVFVKPGFTADGKGNQAAIGSYLGSVNMVSVIPSLLLLAGFLFGLIQMLRFKKQIDMEKVYFVFIALTCLSTLIGYTWFTYSYFTSTDDVIKATYMIQFFIAVILLFAGVMDSIRNKSPLAYQVILVILALVFIHNLPAMITRYSSFIAF